MAILRSDIENCEHFTQDSVGRDGRGVTHMEEIDVVVPEVSLESLDVFL